MASSHTPGPWTAQFADVPYSELGEAWTVDADVHSVCTIDSPTADAEANARLIAAAPELLEQAEFALAKLEDWIRSDLEGTALFSKNMERLEPLRAAIQKARG